MKLLGFILLFGFGCLLYWVAYQNGLRAGKQIQFFEDYRTAMTEVFIPDPTVHKQKHRNLALKQKGE
jgi:hypothetical protein